jgi:hypothetical protein
VPVAKVPSDIPRLVADALARRRPKLRVVRSGGKVPKRAPARTASKRKRTRTAAAAKPARGAAAKKKQGAKGKRRS